ncbi:hypothetical protein ACEPAF_8102 [Sanghuangporus sanghuang]
MSRVPRPAVSNSNLRGQYRGPTTATPRKPTSPTPTGTTSARLRPPSGSPVKSRPTSPSKHVEEKPEPPKPKLSLKEQIALKRAEAKKAQSVQGKNIAPTLKDGLDTIPVKVQNADGNLTETGRWGVRETIERARNTGNLNLSSRSLPCIPSCLFEIHLGVKPQPLDSVTEPDYTAEDTPKRNRPNKQQASWFEAQDLVVLKARSNEITAIQPELALFGSLKVIDLHSNQLKTLPTSLTILSSLTNLDVSNNNLTEIPPAIFSLPALSILNVSHNQLSALPFARFNDPLNLPKSLSVDGFYQPEVIRASEPLPHLHTLDIGHNKLLGAAIDASHLPRAITHITLAHNPLGPSRELIAALAKIDNLQEVILDRAVITDDSFAEPSTGNFPKLQILDLSETQVTEGAIRSYFANSPRSGAVNFNMSTRPPSPGELRVSVGKKIIKEAWEVEAEQRFLKKRKSAINVNVSKDAPEPQAEVIKEPWELEAEQGLATEGGRRRARAAQVQAAANVTASSGTPAKSSIPTQPKTIEALPSKTVEKEQWEIEAEQGILTEGGRRRLRAQQAAASFTKPPDERPRKLSSPSSPTSLASSKYYSASTLTLTLPSSAPPTRSHARAFSTLAMPQIGRNAEDLLVPAPTLPLAAIMKQEFAAKLQVLILSNRRADPTFSFPSSSSLSSAEISGGIPRLSELILDGCALGNMVSISLESNDSGVSIVEKRGLLEVIAETFPWLTILDLSYNNLTSDGITPAVIEHLLVPSEGRKGLKILRLRGNKISSLEAFEQVAGLFRGNRQVPEWGFEELDVRDNEISKLPPLLGLIPMDVCLVDGNVFRVPPRKVWEREGTKGLLSWLRGRIE